MPTYRAPVDDYRFLLTELFDAAQLTAYKEYAEFPPDLMVSVLEEAGRFCEEVLAPINRNGDREGCVWSPDNTVKTPTGFKDA